MRYTYSLVPALIICLLLTCSFKELDKFSQDGISFNVPADWSITDREDLEGEGYYMSCEKSGSDASGLVTVTWVKDIIPLEENAATYVNALKEDFTKRNASFRFDPAVKATYSNNQCTRINYTMKLSQLPQHGTINCFHLCGKTVVVIEQEADEDAEKNRAGFREIEKSFTCN